MLQNLVWFFARRFTLLIGSLVTASALVFFLLRTLPGDLASLKLGVDANPEALMQVRQEFGLDQSLVAQYIEWFSDAARGDLGVSMLTGADISQEILNKATVTLPLIGLASVLAILFAVPLGMYSALNFRNRRGIGVSAASQLGIAIPTFWVGVILITIFAVKFQILPSGGFPDEGWSSWANCLESLILPSTTLALGQGAILMRFARSATIDVIQQDFFRTARSTGLSRGQAIRIHGIRNAIVPVISVLGVQIATLIVGAIIVESVFSLPGIGQMLLQDVGIRDYTKVQGTVAATTAAVFFVSFLIDAIIALINPKARTSQ
ncbi:MAG: ABC transporter permease [Ilumatobacteraceae bacterium]|nr:ABC transporter permease [Ilumatobacteraceae bacterium]MDP4696004.1 ABC transporter permease [Ilumatobacteraceae bacterium]MDP4736164.1 ABC transporter permease [Ilumatobacteraceae bacterium]MDP4850240.1 ABC transporter permease [Ilumatobacteraceae bacterium]MDP4901815.1 ABC transporter permease [Ilumatobacteraceae bacterium]